MFSASQLLTLLILATPIEIIFDGPIIHGLVTAVAAISVAIVSVSMRPGEAGFLSTVIWRVAIVAAIPALWMLIQILPLQTVGLANPIWKSAAIALGRPLAGSISVDPGATFISLVRYMSIAAVVFVAAAVAVDRRRAQWLFLALVAATTVMALMSLVATIGDFAFLSNSGSDLAGDAATDSAGLGIILAGAAALHMFELGLMERPGHSWSAGWYWPAFVVCLVAVAICSLAFILGATSQAYFAVACGVATLAAVIGIRRFDLGPWGVAAIASVISFVAIAIVILQSSDQSVDLTLAFATQSPRQQIIVTQRVLSETSWAGTGAGTFAAILPIYQEIDEIAMRPMAPTAASALVVEMGRLFFLVILMAAIVQVGVLLRGARWRLRDSLYSTVGASCVVVIILLAFCNSALFSTPLLIIAAGVVGLAIAQSKSRLV